MTAPTTPVSEVLEKAAEAAVETAYGHYRAEAVKRGRNPAFPYVPVYRFASAGYGQTTQIGGRAYGTRDEAIRCAVRQIEAFKQNMREQLRKPGYRALREQFGMPSELPQ